jgi:phospholipid/cholesterol/gamma-HCH transport system ATP-binding protein
VDVVIQVDGVRKAMGGRTILDGVSLEIPRGRITAIIGPSGGGKTLLLKHLAGLLRPDEGRILVDGEDVARLAGRRLMRLRERFGFVFQGGALFDSMSVFDNVAFPLREKTRMDERDVRARVRARLDEVGLAADGEKLPGELSGGMRKRAALARALVRDPDLAFFDEPTTGLDPILLDSVQRLIAEAQARLGFTGIVVSHDIPEIFDIADHVAVLAGGRVVEVGPPDAIRASSHPMVRRLLRPARSEDA